MKIVILIYQIIQEKFTYGELFMLTLVMIGYIGLFMFEMVKKMQNSGLEIGLVAGLTRPLKGNCAAHEFFVRLHKYS